MLCLGIWIDTLNMSLSVSSFRVTELHRELERWLAKSKFKRREIQQLLGKLSFVSACIRPGQAFMCRLLNALRSYVSCPKITSMPVTDEIRSDIEWWLFFLSHYNGISVIPSDILFSNPELFTTNACFSGSLFRRVFSPCGGLTGIFVPDLVPCISRVHRKEHDNSIRRVLFVL